MERRANAGKAEAGGEPQTILTPSDKRRGNRKPLPCTRHFCSYFSQTTTFGPTRRIMLDAHFTSIIHPSIHPSSTDTQTAMHLRFSIFLLLWITSIKLAFAVKPFRPHGGPQLGPRPMLLLNDNSSKNWLIDRTQTSFPILAGMETPVVSALTSAMVAKGLFDLWHNYFGRRERPQHLTARRGLSLWEYIQLGFLYSVFHTDLIHLLVNLFFTHCFGTRIEQAHGSGRTLALVGSAVVGGGLINLAGWHRFDGYQGRGSSGISLALLSAYAFGEVLKQYRAPSGLGRVFSMPWGRKPSRTNRIASFVSSCS